MKRTIERISALLFIVLAAHLVAQERTKTSVSERVLYRRVNF
jgi:hypothetical protein